MKFGVEKQYKNFTLSLLRYYRTQTNLTTALNEDNEESKIEVSKVSTSLTALLTYVPHERVITLLGLNYKDHIYAPLVGAKVNCLGANIVGAVEYKNSKFNYSLSVELNK
jgi:hypothetical protein